MFFLALLSAGMTLERFKAAIFETAQATAMIFFIIIGAAIYNGFLALTQLPQELAVFIEKKRFEPLGYFMDHFAVLSDYGLCDG